MDLQSSIVQQLVQYIAWPASLSIIVIVSIIVFKKEIGLLICRIHKIGNYITTTPNLPQDKQNKDDNKRVSEQSFSTPGIKIREDELRSLEEFKSLSKDELNDILFKKLAGQSLATEFERIYQLIYGSQIKILQYLNSQQTGAHLTSIKHYYDKAVLEFADAYKDYSFENYMRFLLNYTLILQKDGFLFITICGKEFLLYCTVANKNLDKLF